MAAPTFIGQEITLALKTDAGDCAVTILSTVDEFAHTVVTLNDAGDYVILRAIEIGSNLRWRIVQEEGALFSNAIGVGNIIADPGDAAAIPVIYKHVSIGLTVAGVETNTLAIPTMVGQTMTLWADAVSSNERTITVAAAINVANNTTIEFDAVSIAIKLEAVTVAGALVWQVGWNDGATLA